MRFFPHIYEPCEGSILNTKPLCRHFVIPHLTRLLFKLDDVPSDVKPHLKM